ncbi:TolC family protein [Shewanella woodyi]|uniref:TolC family protein n=1 Tax=Shewanella woodyi TaxID=60961 RepID=UPI0009EEA599|nr:TolC family protein [Shewanella woodyi]
MKRYLESALLACKGGLMIASACTLVLLPMKGVAAVSLESASDKTITLPWVLEKTLLSNPQLQSFPYELRVSEALTLQAGITPNPKLSVELENLLGTGDKQGVENAEISLGLSQLIELGDKRQRRIDFAHASKRQSLAEYELLRLEVLSQATQSYYQLLRLQALLEWNQHGIQIEEKALKAIELRAKAGAVAKADVTKMALRLMRARSAQQQLEGDVQVAKQRLAANWAGEAHFDRAEGELGRFTELPSAADVLNAIETAPQYLQLLSVERLMYAKRRVEESKAQYDITLGMGVRSYDGFDDAALMFNFSMPIPLSNPNQGNILAAKANESLAMEQQKLVRGQLKLTLLEIHQSMVNSALVAELLQKELQPLAQRLLKETELAYQTGQANVLQLADAQSELLNIKRELIEAKTAVYLQKLELERITGQSMSAAHQRQLSHSFLNTEPMMAQENH